MTPVTSLLTALERHDIAALTDLLEHDGMDEHFTCEDAAALWDAGWHAWLGEDREGHASWHAEEAGDELRRESWAAPSHLERPQLWPITLGMFLRMLHATFPALPGAPAWAALQDVEEE